MVIFGKHGPFSKATYALWGVGSSRGQHVTISSCLVLTASTKSGSTDTLQVCTQ